jgi:hypothetical protein
MKYGADGYDMAIEKFESIINKGLVYAVLTHNTHFYNSFVPLKRPDETHTNTEFYGRFIEYFQKQGVEFMTYKNFLEL